MAADAQEIKPETMVDDTYSRQPYNINSDIINDITSATDTLHLPDLDDRGRVISHSFYPTILVVRGATGDFTKA